MTIRTRPVLDRKHRPRWQDELRTQQLTIVGFAMAIAVAIGIFGAAAWNGYWESHFRPIAVAAGTTFDRADLVEREAILTAELVAEASELQEQLIGPRIQVVQQQIDSLSTIFNTITTDSVQSLVDAEVLASRADELGVAVTDAEVDLEVAERVRLRERINAHLILVTFLPAGAGPDDEPTDEQRAAAGEAAQAALDRIEDGEEFAVVAAEVSGDFTAASGGELGWFEDGDVAYDDYFDALADADAGDVIGPFETDRGAAVVKLIQRRDAVAEGPLLDFLRAQDIDYERYRDYVRDDILIDAYRQHFENEVVITPVAQQRVAQILIAPVEGEAVPEVRARHILVQPDPALEDQNAATPEQWEAALEEAREVQVLVSTPDADWFALATEHSDEPAAGARGGDLGWSDPAQSPYVAEFTVALAALELDEVSDPIRTQFGYHIIQKTGERDSPLAEAAALIEQLRADPESFAEVATRVSEHHETAKEGGELGWVAPYQLLRIQEDAIFALAEVNDISDPVDSGGDGIAIYQLLEASESREIEDERLGEIRANGFERWLDEVVRNGVDTWLDPQFTSSTGTT
jgi:parvulin-like peptidyl-prolyl isomerase